MGGQRTGLEKCCLRLRAKSFCQQAKNDLKTLMGISIGGSSLHRLVQKIELPAGQGETEVSALSVDGGKIRLRSEETGKVLVPPMWPASKKLTINSLL